MRVDRQYPPAAKRGFTLPEVLVSAAIFGLVVAGATASTLLFARVAADHESHADFHNSLRRGFEQIAFDARNASGFDKSAATRFDVATIDGAAVRYEYVAADGHVTRSENGGAAIPVLRNVDAFDIDTSVADELTLDFTLKTTIGRAKSPRRDLSVTFKKRN